MKLKQWFTVHVTPTYIDKTIEKLSDYPQKYLLSPLLKEQKELNIKKVQEQINLDVQTQYQAQKNRQLSYFTPLTKYKEFAHKHPHGKVHIFNYLDVNFTLAGSQWEHVPVKNLYKLLVYTRPQLIMLQLRPDQILKGFNYKFTSSKDYIEQITRDPDEVMPVGYASKIAETLNHQELEFTEYEPYINRERIGNDKIATLAYYAKKFDAKIMLADLPSLNFRESLCNSLTLPQLQQYFEQVAVATPLNPDIIPNTPMNVAYQILPNIFLKRSDEFMATLIEYLAAKKGYKKVFGIFGNMQSDSIVDLIENRSATHLREELDVPKIKRSILKELTCEDLIERHAILDVMFYGDVINECNIKQHSYYFPETNSVIQKYADPQFVDKTRSMQMKYLHLEMLKKYQRFADFYYTRGKEQLQEEYIVRGGLV